MSISAQGTAIWPGAIIRSRGGTLRRPAMASLLVVLLLGVMAPVVAAKPHSPPPDVMTISPASGLRGATVTLTAKGIGGPKARIWVGDVPATVTSLKGTHATFTVPATAPFGLTTVRVANPSGKFDTVPFTVLYDGRIHPVLDGARSSVSAIGPAGGFVNATGADGVTYRLAVPAGALDAGRLITLTPVAAIADLPLSRGLAAAAQFEPSGLHLAVPGTLTITFPGSVPPLVAFAYGGDGTDFAVVASSVGAQAVTIAVEHFSGAGAGTPSAADFDALVAPFLVSLGQLTRSQVSELAALTVAWTLLFGPTFCVTSASCNAAMQRAHDSLVAIAQADCRAGMADLGTTPALASAYDSVGRLTDDEVLWDQLRAVDAALGAGAIAPDSIPISVAGQSSAGDCRTSTFNHVIARATELAQAEPFATSEIGAAPGEDNVSNIGWLLDLAAGAQLLGLEDSFPRALEDANSIVEGLVAGDPTIPGSGVGDRAMAHPFEDAPAAGQEPFVVTVSDFDGDGRSSAWEWLYYLSGQSQVLGLEVSSLLPAYVEHSLEKIIHEGDARCLTEESAGRADLEHGFKYALGADFLVARFEEALAACGIRITLSPMAPTVEAGGQVQFSATVTGSSATDVLWSSPDAARPTSGLFQAPLTPGLYHVVATVEGHPSRKAETVVTVSGGAVSVSVDPATATLDPGQQQQFQATVTGSPNQAVIWSATCGTMSSAGLYTAPAQDGLCSVTATSDAVPSASATIVVTVGAQAGIAVTISPGGELVEAGREVYLAPGGTQQFAAVVTGTPNHAVTWSATCGQATASITQAGLFTAPAVVTDATGRCTVEASSVADPFNAYAIAIVFVGRVEIVSAEGRAIASAEGANPGWMIGWPTSQIATGAGSGSAGTGAEPVVEGARLSLAGGPVASATATAPSEFNAGIASASGSADANVTLTFRVVGVVPFAVEFHGAQSVTGEASAGSTMYLQSVSQGSIVSTLHGFQGHIDGRISGSSTASMVGANLVTDEHPLSDAGWLNAGTYELSMEAGVSADAWKFEDDPSRDSGPATASAASAFTFTAGVSTGP